MTDAQRKVYRFLQDCVRENGYPPTRREIANAMGYSSANAAECHLRALERQGAIRMVAGGARKLQLNTAYEERS
jgi:repressor LexA